MSEESNTESYRVTAEELSQFVSRFENLEAEKNELAEQQKEVISELKDRGYDAKVFRQLIRIRKKAQEELQEEEALLKMYMEALGMSV